VKKIVVYIRTSPFVRNTSLERCYKLEKKKKSSRPEKMYFKTNAIFCEELWRILNPL